MIRDCHGGVEQGRAIRRRYGTRETGVILWNEIVADLKAWTVFARMPREGE